MRILFLLTQDLKSPSGLGRYKPLAQGLVSLGHQVHIAALHANYAELSDTHFVDNGITVDYVAPMHVMKKGDDKQYYPITKLVPILLRSTHKLTQAALKQTADIIHIGKPHPMNGLAGLAAKYIRGRILFLDCDDYEAGSGRFTGKVQQSSVALFEKHFPKRVDFVTTNTSFMRSNLVDWGISTEQIHYLPNGVDRNRFTPPSRDDKEFIRKKLGLEGKKVVVYIGSLSLPSHPVDLLIAAFPQILNAHPDAVLLLVGGGEDYQNMRMQARDLGIGDKVRFVGRVPPEDVPIYYSQADISVEPVHDNTAAMGRSPLKLFESWTCGVPFVTADVGDRRTLIGSPPAGALVRPGNSVALAEAIIELLSAPEKAQAFREMGLIRVQGFYWDELAKDLESVYMKTLQGKTR
jgi:glycosyltransferase involved in cell wall biosynthesis